MQSRQRTPGNAAFAERADSLRGPHKDVNLANGQAKSKPEGAVKRASAKLKKNTGGQLATNAQDPSPSANGDPVLLMKRAYRAMWTGILSEQRIEEESRWIERLFHA
jgi:hypothetical protein